MYLWQRRATHLWCNNNEDALRAIAGDWLAVIERPERKRIELEVASRSRDQLRELSRKFGGRIRKLPSDWLKRSLRHKTKPIKVGERKLIIPSGAAFGKGEHATTATCLAMLKRIVRTGDVVVDLGTGSGILALAARLLRAKRVIAIDNDPTAIRVAKQNARLNKIRDVEFRLSDVRRWKMPKKVDIVAANLFSELLVEILPRFKTARALILSGFLREQERDVRRALTRNKIDIVDVQRRGKWVAILARRR